ncbi:hypothetical protein EDL98_11410 [Ornithobacterium rhinotracheale]|nr:hypothetical protein [Ornithobacterium rhinotracheale]
MAQSNVGVNTETPQASLEVNGNVTLNVANAAGTTETYDLLIDKNTRRLAVVNKKAVPFNSIQYKVITTIGDDWVYSANTGVPASKYTALLTASYFGNFYRENFYIQNPKNWATDVVYGIRHIEGDRNKNVSETTSIDVGSDGNWYISADYDGADPYIGGNQPNVWDSAKYDQARSSFYWTFDVLFVDNNFIKDLGEITDISMTVNNSGIGSWDTANGANPIEYLKGKL